MIRRPFATALPEPLTEAMAQLRAAGHTVHVVGGAVRDLVLGLVPREYDLATSATPQAVMELFPRAHPVGLAFGVVLIVCEDMRIEVASFRRDVDYVDGRHPTRIEPASLEEDASRRDFSVNALYYDPVAQVLLDPCEGLHDLGARELRAVGVAAQRFAEDHLRLLRAARLAAQLNFSIESKTWEAMAPLAPQLSRISAERQRDELLKLLCGPRPGRGLRILYYSGLLDSTLPEISAMVGVAQPAQFHPEGDVFVHTCLVLEALQERSVPLALAALLHDVGKPPTYTVAERIRFDGHVQLGAEMAGAILSRLRLDQPTIETVVELVRHHLHFVEAPNMRPSTLKRFLRLPYFAAQLELHRADCLASHGDLSLYEFCQERLAGLDAEELRPLRLLDGDDLRQLGYRPGPLFRRIFEALETEQLEGRIASEFEAREFVRRNWPIEESA